jgi:hypothetical protein
MPTHLTPSVNEIDHKPNQGNPEKFNTNSFPLLIVGLSTKLNLLVIFTSSNPYNLEEYHPKIVMPQLANQKSVPERQE